MTKEEKIVGQCKSSVSKELEKEYLEDLDHYDEGMGIHSSSYAKCKERFIRLAKIDNAIAICKKANEQKYVYIKESYGIIKEKFLDDLDYEVLNNRLYVCSRGMYYDFPFKDYGNWWALTKEELE